MCDMNICVLCSNSLFNLFLFVKAVTNPVLNKKK